MCARDELVCAFNPFSFILDEDRLSKSQLCQGFHLGGSITHDQVDHSVGIDVFLGQLFMALKSHVPGDIFPLLDVIHRQVIVRDGVQHPQKVTQGLEPAGVRLDQGVFCEFQVFI